MSDLKDELERERREKEWAETWKPSEPGDMLIGTLEGYDEAETDFGEYTVAHIRDEDGVLRGLWLMHSVLQDEWKESSPEVGERVGVQYLGQRSGENFDYHMWTVKVDRSEATATETAADENHSRNEETPQASTGGNRPPQERDSESRQDARPEGSGAPDFEGDELFGSPALDTAGEGDGRNETPQEDTGGESTIDDPNGDLPF